MRRRAPWTHEKKSSDAGVGPVRRTGPAKVAIFGLYFRSRHFVCRNEEWILQALLQRLCYMAYSVSSTETTFLLFEWSRSGDSLDFRCLRLSASFRFPGVALLWAVS
jgi:hypothetical protein